MAGENGNDRFLGGGGNDTILGGFGGDNINGGSHDDYLKGENSNDVVRGALGNDTIFGDQGNDRLLGDAGDDYLVGGSGNDTIFGGSGADQFIFNSPSEQVDQIADFNVVDDQILLNSNGFTSLSVGILSSNQFTIGSQADNSDQRIIYDDLTGDLWFDPDGIGLITPTKVASLATNLALNEQMFTVF